MKTFIATALAILIGSFVLADEMKLPDLAKAFPDEMLFTQTKISTIETYGYLTDRSFSDLKLALQDYLGEGWVEVKQAPGVDKAVNQQIEDQDATLVGNLLFSHPVFPDIHVGFTMMEMNISGKKYLANITVIRKNTEHGKGL